MATSISHIKQIVAPVGMNTIILATFFSPKYCIEQISYQGKQIKYEIK